MTAEIIDLFPIPLVIDDNIRLDSQEKAWLLNHSQDFDNFWQNDFGNYTSTDSYILDHTPKLCADIQNAIKKYAEHIIMDKNLLITQSWLNRNPTGTLHGPHAHGNSIISGVIYLQVDEDTSPIVFHRPSEQVRMFSNNLEEKEGKYTYTTWHFKPKYSQLFLFPSTLVHSVIENKSKQDRISLSFNTFYRGAFGDKRRLTYVDTKRMEGKS